MSRTLSPSRVFVCMHPNRAFEIRLQNAVHPAGVCSDRVLLILGRWHRVGPQSCVGATSEPAQAGREDAFMFARALGGIETETSSIGNGFEGKKRPEEGRA